MILCFLFHASGIALSEDQTKRSQDVVFPDDSLSFRLELAHSLDRGLNWFVSKQTESGHWSMADHPAITAMAITALLGDPLTVPTEKRHRQEAVDSGLNFIRENAQPDGGIYQGKNLMNYNTAVSLIALVAADRAEFDSTIRNARKFLVNMQMDFGEKGKRDTALDGGIGYGNRYPHSDLVNTLYALEALHYSAKHLQKDGSDRNEIEKNVDLNWDAAIQFIQNCQNLPKFNSETWASDDPQNRGGFIYFPGNSKAEEMELVDGRTALRSYGSISYAGMLSYMYADLDRKDPRISAVFEWLQSNYSLDENPGMGIQGLYFYYHTMAKALSTYGIDKLETKDGKSRSWARELGSRLLDRQKEDGSWLNDSGRWWERDPALVSAYAVLSLEILYRHLE